jgi:uncharacterized protein YdhG (YjbR/CyaY superfamily)
METITGAPTTVDEYIAQFPEEIQLILDRIRSVIKESAPDAVEKISYKMPAYFSNGRLIYFSVNKRHIGIYPLTSGMEASIEGLSAYKGTKSSIHFPLDKPMPYELLSKIVKYRVAENLGQ